MANSSGGGPFKPPTSNLRGSSSGLHVLDNFSETSSQTSGLHGLNPSLEISSQPSNPSDSPISPLSGLLALGGTHSVQPSNLKASDNSSIASGALLNSQFHTEITYGDAICGKRKAVFQSGPRKVERSITYLEQMSERYIQLSEQYKQMSQRYKQMSDQNQQFFNQRDDMIREMKQSLQQIYLEESDDQLALTGAISQHPIAHINLAQGPVESDLTRDLRSQLRDAELKNNKVLTDLDHLRKEYSNLQKEHTNLRTASKTLEAQKNTNLANSARFKGLFDRAIEWGDFWESKAGDRLAKFHSLRAKYIGAQDLLQSVRICQGSVSIHVMREQAKKLFDHHERHNSSLPWTDKDGTEAWTLEKEFTSSDEEDAESDIVDGKEPVPVETVSDSQVKDVESAVVKKVTDLEKLNSQTHQFKHNNTTTTKPTPSPSVGGGTDSSSQVKGKATNSSANLPKVII